jgi:hypothetical protein
MIEVDLLIKIWRLPLYGNQGLLSARKHVGGYIVTLSTAPYGNSIMGFYDNILFENVPVNTVTETDRAEDPSHSR